MCALLWRDMKRGPFRWSAISELSMHMMWMWIPWGTFVFSSCVLLVYLLIIPWFWHAHLCMLWTSLAFEANPSGGSIFKSFCCKFSCPCKTLCVFILLRPPQTSLKQKWLDFGRRCPVKKCVFIVRRNTMLLSPGMVASMAGNVTNPNTQRLVSLNLSKKSWKQGWKILC